MLRGLGTFLSHFALPLKPLQFQGHAILPQINCRGPGSITPSANTAHQRVATHALQEMAEATEEAGLLLGRSSTQVTLETEVSPAREGGDGAADTAAAARWRMYASHALRCRGSASKPGAVAVAVRLSAPRVRSPSKAGRGRPAPPLPCAPPAAAPGASAPGSLQQG